MEEMHNSIFIWVIIFFLLCIVFLLDLSSSSHHKSCISVLHTKVSCSHPLKWFSTLGFYFWLIPLSTTCCFFSLHLHIFPFLYQCLDFPAEFYCVWAEGIPLGPCQPLGQPWNVWICWQSCSLYPNREKRASNFVMCLECIISVWPVWARCALLVPLFLV